MVGRVRGLWWLLAVQTASYLSVEGEGVMEVGRGGEGYYYTYRYTVTTRMTPALRWAAMRAILKFH